MIGTTVFQSNTSREDFLVHRNNFDCMLFLVSQLLMCRN